MVVGSVAFSVQGDLVTAIQLLYVLEQQRVPPKNVYAFLPRQENVTVQNPQSHPLGPQLFVPHAYDHRVCYDRIGYYKVCKAMQKFVNSTDFDAIVFFFLNHDNENALTVDQDTMSVQHFKAMFQPDSSKHASPKSVLAVIDSCRSTKFAKRVMDRDLLPPPPDGMCILSSSPTVAMTTAFVLSDSVSLVNINPDGSGVNYGVFGTSFMREFMDLICYSGEDPKMESVANRLNGRIGDPRRRGFTASCFGQPLEMSRTLRYFFGKRVDPDTAVEGGFLFRDILPPPMGNVRFDDYSETFLPGTIPGEAASYRFVRIAENRDREGRLIGYGVCEYGEVPKLADPPDPIALQLAQHKEGLEGSDQVPIHVNILDLLAIALQGLTPQSPAMDFAEEQRRFSEACDILEEVNGFEEPDRFFLAHLVRQWGVYSHDRWREVIRTARKAIRQAEKGRRNGS
jgi:hypothetical protein